jgi:hypothetical protein
MAEAYHIDDADRRLLDGNDHPLNGRSSMSIGA